MRKSTRAALVGGLAVALGVTGCSTKADSSSSGSGSGDVKTDIGITAKEINLGVLTDLSGVFKNLGLAYTAGNQLWADDVNAKGGVCGRQVKLDVADTAYKADTAVTLYASMKSKDAGIIQMVGSQILAALKSQITADNMLSIPASWASTNLDSDAVFMVGATYDVEMINGLAYLQKKGMLKDGDKIGHIYIGGEYGGGGLLGSQAYAKDHNQTVVEEKIASTDTDMAAAVTDLKSKGVNVIAVTTTPAQMASAATQAQAQGLDVPIVGNNPTYDPTLLNTPAKDALGKYYRSESLVPFSSDVPLAKEIAKKYATKYPNDKPNDAVDFGYASGIAYQAVLEKACSNKDLTRAGIVKAKSEVKVDVNGLMDKLDFSKPGQPSTRSTYIEQADPSAVGGLRVVQDLSESTEAKNYKTPFQK